MNNFNLPIPSSDFQSVRDGRTAPLFYVDIALDTARSVGAGTALRLPLNANALYVDSLPAAGFATIYFQDTRLSGLSAPVYVGPGFIAKVPFTELLIENAAQAGRVLRLVYGVDVNFQPGTGQSVLATIASPLLNGSVLVNEFGVPANAVSFKSASALAANTPENVFSAAANVNGAILWQASQSTRSLGTCLGSLLCKATAPVNLIDGTVLAMQFEVAAAGADFVGRLEVNRPIRIAAGLRLDFISSLATTLRAASCMYTLL